MQRCNLLGSAETIATIAHVREVLIEGSGGKLKEAADHCVCTPSNETPRIQKCHILIGHVISELVKQTIFHQQGGISGS
jgi:D-sedoheptulose 7-phosphate isomerase